MPIYFLTICLKGCPDDSKSLLFKHFTEELNQFSFEKMAVRGRKARIDTAVPCTGTYQRSFAAHLGGTSAKELDPTSQCSLRGKMSASWHRPVSQKKKAIGYIRTPDPSDNTCWSHSPCVYHRFMSKLSLGCPCGMEYTTFRSIPYLPHTLLQARLVDQPPQAREGTAASQESRKEEEMIYVCSV